MAKTVKTKALVTDKDNNTALVDIEDIKLTVILTPEQFLISKGIDPPLRSAPLNSVSFDKLVELLNEYKG